MRRLKDMREYIAALREIGELQEVDSEVDWNLEIGAIVRRSYDLRHERGLGWAELTFWSTMLPFTPTHVVRQSGRRLGPPVRG
jgi:4-hydroxy-3-polyprenylbenzoate decarboxylase